MSGVWRSSRSAVVSAVLRAVVIAVVIAAVSTASLVVMVGSADADTNEAPVGNIPASAVSAGRLHTCAVLDTGAVTCWGTGTLGRLGLGDAVSRGDDPDEMGVNLPTVDLGTGRTARSLALGAQHTCALLDNGTIKCWGSGADGRRGDGGTADRGGQPGQMGDALPAVDLGTGRTALAVTAGRAHSCALLDDHSVKCWGFAIAGQLGNGDPNPRGDESGEMGDDLPAVDLGSGRTARAITAGDDHTCALLDNGTIKCWGNAGSGQLGYGDTTPRGNAPGQMGDALPAVDLGTGRTATAVTAGGAHTCAILDNGTVKCWGSGISGRLGYGDTEFRGLAPGQMGDDLPAVDLGPGRTATAITAGEEHTCALLDNGAVACWGRGLQGQLGTGTGDDRGNGTDEMGANLLTVDLGTGRTATAVTTGNSHSCALLDDATLKCWGEGSGGRLGNGRSVNIGARLDQMGDDLPPVLLSRLVGRAGVDITLTADRPSVVAGATIGYTVVVRNTGAIPLTDTVVRAPDVPACGRVFARLSPRTTTTFTCAYVTSADDAPQMSNQVFIHTAQGVSSESARIRTRVDPRVARADGSVRARPGAFLGDNTYNATSTDQTAIASTTKRKPVRYTWRIQNDGNITDTFRLRGTAGTNKFTVTYRRGSTNITAAVRAGTFTTATLAPGATTDVTITVTPTKRARTGDTFTATLAARSVASSISTDTARTTIIRR